MIIQCEKCQTKFRLDDSRVTDKGVKVRCTKCKHVFTVQKDKSDAESFVPGGALTGLSFAAGQGEAPAATPEDQRFATESAPDAPLASEAFKDTSFRSVPTETGSYETASFDASAISFESDGFYDAGAEKGTAETVKPAAKGSDVDFSGFDFGDSDSEPDSTPPSAASVDDFTDTPIEPTSATPHKEAPQGLDFSDDDMFGTVVQPALEASSETIPFDFEGDSFAESMDMSGQDSGGKKETLFSLDMPGDAPFNLGEIDFGAELTSVAVRQVNPDDLKPSQEILFAPLAEARDKSSDDELTRSFLEVAPAGDQQELPPLSIASRRKQSPLFGSLIAVIAVLVISVLGYLGYSSFSPSKEAAAPETSKIDVQDVKATFIENDEAGELLVVSGKVLNESIKTRAALQVKVTVFDASGQSIATKIAYGGNPLTEEQLEVLPLDKIEAAMANQFGDSLANMEVAPGKAVPFVVVLANIPKGAKDFGIQPAGSTVATGKQQ